MKKRKKNNKGFTLVELLVVIVILIAIVSIAIPSITSSMERSKEKLNEGKKETIGTAAELYLNTINRSALKGFYNGECIVLLDSLVSGDYIDEDDIMNADNKPFADGNPAICKGCIDDEKYSIFDANESGGYTSCDSYRYDYSYNGAPR